MHTVGLALTDGTPLFELAAVEGVFGAPRPPGTSDWYDVRLCAEPGARMGDWFTARTPYGLDALATADTVVVPACHDGGHHPPQALVDALVVAHAAGARIVSICTGAFALAAAGLLDGRHAATHWQHADTLAARHPRVAVDRDVLYVDEGDVLTSAGKAAGIDLCLHVVATDHGTAAANAVARRLVVAPHRDGGQAQFISEPVPADADHRLAATMAWALEHLDEPIDVEDLADHAHTSSRQLARVFAATAGTTPGRWLVQQRVDRAKARLERTDEDVETIARAVGLGSSATLRRHFRDRLGTTPTRYRRAFRSDDPRDCQEKP